MDPNAEAFVPSTPNYRPRGEFEVDPAAVRQLDSLLDQFDKKGAGGASVSGGDDIKPKGEYSDTVGGAFGDPLGQIVAKMIVAAVTSAISATQGDGYKSFAATSHRQPEQITKVQDNVGAPSLGRLEPGH